MNRRIALLASLSLAIAACGKEPKPTGDLPVVGSAPTGAVTPDPGGKIITVEMTSDEKGNYFSPSVVDAKPGDVIRYTLKLGVHNVNFHPDSNRGVAGLPPASEMLQLPGQTWDYKVTLSPGDYHFHCDPHVALGMSGRLHVTK